MITADRAGVLPLRNLSSQSWSHIFAFYHPHEAQHHLRARLR